MLQHVAEKEPVRVMVKERVVPFPPPPGAGDEDRAAAALEALVAAGARARPAAAVVAELTGVAANRLYRRVSASSGPPGRCGE